MPNLTDTFTNIANAIRAKLEVNSTYTPDEMSTAITSIPVRKPEQTKTITAETSAITVLPDNGKVFSSVTINPTPSETKTIIPTITGQTISPSNDKLFSSISVDPIYYNEIDNIAGGKTVTIGITGV